MTKIRVRQHVNPFHRKYQIPLTPPNWADFYSNLEQEFYLDIGCARGKFLLSMATLHPEINFLGVEIRESLVEEANLKARASFLTNLYYLFTNINTNVENLLLSLPPGKLSFVTIQFPDPWFKNRHAKRRVVQSELVDSLSRYLVSGGKVFLQSDVLAIAQEMVHVFSEHPNFVKTHPDWLEVNPLAVPTERELGTIANSQPVYRALFVKP